MSNINYKNALRRMEKQSECKDDFVNNLYNLDKDELKLMIDQLQQENKELDEILLNLKADAVPQTVESEKQSKQSFDFSKCHYRRVLLRVLYIGWNYHGLESHKDFDGTIEEHLFNALTKSCLIESKEKAHYNRCSRTDKGTSAYGQVLSLSIRSKYPKDEQDSPEALENELSYCKMLNRLLPKDIKVIAWMPIPLTVDARMNCQKRQYKYYFPHCSLDIDAMKEGCENLQRFHDLINLCKLDVRNCVWRYARRILRAEILPVDNADVGKPTSMYYFLIEAKSFLRCEIRHIMALLLMIGQGKEKPGIIWDLVDTDQFQRRPNYSTSQSMPASLSQCFYDVDGKWMYDAHVLDDALQQLGTKWTINTIKSTIIEDVIEDLTTKVDTTEIKKAKDFAYSMCLYQDAQPKVHTPLLEKETCNGIFQKIDYYTKRKRGYPADAYEQYIKIKDSYDWQAEYNM